MRRLADQEEGDDGDSALSLPITSTRPRRLARGLLMCVAMVFLYAWMDISLLDGSTGSKASSNSLSLAQTATSAPEATAESATQTAAESVTSAPDSKAPTAAPSIPQTSLKSTPRPTRPQTHAPTPPTFKPPPKPTVSPTDEPQATDETIMETVDDLAISTTEEPAANTTKQFAYMFYVTKDIYGCAALHLMDNLVNTVGMNTSRIDLVVLHSPDVSQRMLDKIQAAVPVRLIAVDSIHADISEPTWLESLTKLNAFRDWGYDRVVYMDADGVPLKNLDHLFDLPSNVLYSPTAYWLKQPFFMSAMLVIEPSDALFEQMIRWARERGAAAGFDMDILNSYFAETVIMLPGDYTVLNSDFRAPPDAPNKLYTTTTELKEHTQFVHFSCRPDGAYGKPWTAQSHDLSRYKQQGFDPLFAELYEAFWKTQAEKC